MKKKENLQSRREFFKKAAKGALPILAAVALASAPTFLKAKEKTPMNCGFRGCTGTCQGSCEGLCATTCFGGCPRQCTSCIGGCSGSCTGCTGGCFQACYTSCRGENQPPF